MTKKEIEKYKKLLLEHREAIMNSASFKSKEELHIHAEDLSDEGDLATHVINQQVSCDLKRRGIEKLRQISWALERIENGEYGHCEDCGEPIGKKRLENQPWAELCITHAEEREKEERFRRAG